MNKSSQPITVLMAEDDPDDRLLAEKAWKGHRLNNEMRFVEDGEELMDYLYRRGKYADPGSSPRPGVILLDLNMPRKDGREALEEIKRDPNLSAIPIVVLTTSTAEEDIMRSYLLGVSSYIQKPMTLDGLVRVLQTLGQYWLEIVSLPPDPAAD